MLCETIVWAASSEFVSSSILSWQILTTHAQPFRGAMDLAFCLKVPLDSQLVWASSGGSGETAQMRRLAWTFAARIGDKYQIRLARPVLEEILSCADRRSMQIKVIILKNGDTLDNTIRIWKIQTSEEMSHSSTKPTKWCVCPAKTQISLGICPVWSESSLCSQWVAEDPRFLHVDSKDSDQPGWMPMPRLIWVFAGCTGHFVDFVMRQLRLL